MFYKILKNEGFLWSTFFLRTSRMCWYQQHFYKWKLLDYKVPYFWVICVVIWIDVPLKFEEHCSFIRIVKSRFNLRFLQSISTENHFGFSIYKNEEIFVSSEVCRLFYMKPLNLFYQAIVEFSQKCLFLIGRVGKVPENEKLRKGDYTSV